MADDNNGRIVREVWYGVGEATQCIRGDDQTYLKLVEFYFGDRSEHWILMLTKDGDKELERHNAKMATTIIWETKP